jgi:hypothetical protein
MLGYQKSHAGVARPRVVIEVNTMDHHLHTLKAYVDSKFAKQHEGTALIFNTM